MEPGDVVHRFFDRLSSGDVDGALELIDDDIVYTNVGLPTARGRRQTASVFKQLDRPFAGLSVSFVNSATNGGVVLTERIDELRIGKLRVQFWVCGRIEVRAGRITVWRDYFDFVDVVKGLIRGIVAIPFPSVQKPLSSPAQAD